MHEKLQKIIFRTSFCGSTSAVVLLSADISKDDSSQSETDIWPRSLSASKSSPIMAVAIENCELILKKLVKVESTSYFPE